MIEIVNDSGMMLDLSENFGLTIERNNPLFLNGDDFFQDITYPGKAPLTENNKIFIGLGQLAERDIYRYELPVSVYVDSTPYFSGTFAYDIEGSEINFFLKVGYGDIAELCEKTKLNDLKYNGDLGITYAMKQDSIVNPDNYPYSFFPIWHETEKVEELAEAGQPVTYFTNPYDFVNQVKYEWKEPDPKPWRDLPHFKLSHILREAVKFLGFTASGNFFADPQIKNLYIVNLQFTRPPRDGEEQSVPHITISELFTALKQRFRVNVTFDHLNRRAIFSTPNVLLNSLEYIDISDFPTSIPAIKTPDRFSYKIEGDQQESDFNPPNHITITDPNRPGLPEEEVTVKISTMRQFTNTEDNYSYPATSLPFLTGRAINPAPENTLWRTPYDSDRHSAVHLVSYSGLTEVSPGKYFPTAYPVSFSLTDGDWYVFLNDSKMIQLRAYLPPYLLAMIDPYQKIGFLTKENLLMVGIIEKMEYTLTHKAQELIEVTFDLYSLFEKKSIVTLAENEAVPDERTGRKRDPREKRPLRPF